MTEPLTLADDPIVAKVLTNIASLSAERDALLLDRASLEKHLAISDGKLAHLQEMLDRAISQRDHFMSRLVELTTHFSTIKASILSAERAVLSAKSAALDDGAAAIAQKFAPQIPGSPSKATP